MDKSSILEKFEGVSSPILYTVVFSEEEEEDTAPFRIVYGEKVCITFFPALFKLPEGIQKRAVEYAIARLSFYGAFRRTYG